jgi:hypothetical protein
LYFQSATGWSSLAIKMRLHLRAIVNKLARLPADAGVLEQSSAQFLSIL